MPQPDRVMALPVPDEDALPEDLQAYFERCREKLGLVPNVLRAYAMRPDRLRAFITTYNTIMLGESGLTVAEREMIAVVVSSINRCYYCLVAHGQTLRQMTADPELAEMLAIDYTLIGLVPRQRAILDFAAKLTREPRTVEEADRARLRRVGLADADIFDVCEVAAFFNLTNRMAQGLDMMPNREYHRMDR